MHHEPCNCVVWLEWPEKCFRVDAEALSYLKELLPEGSEVVHVKSEHDFLHELPRATHAIVWNFKREWFAKAPRLRVLATPGAGRELVAHGEDAPEGVTVHFGGYHGAIISETVAGFILAWAHGFFTVAERHARGETIWPRAWLGDGCRDVAGSNAVIVGYGKIGKAIGAKLEALGVSVSGFSRANIAGLPEAAKSADWFIMALPSDTGTDNFLNAQLIDKLPRHCVVVNIGRGNSIDESALRKALESGRIAGAYLDVFKDEPGVLKDIVRTDVAEQGKNSSALPLHSAPCPHLIAMPHSAAFSPSYMKRCFKELKDEGLLI